MNEYKVVAKRWDEEKGEWVKAAIGTFDSIDLAKLFADSMLMCRSTHTEIEWPDGYRRPYVKGE